MSKKALFPLFAAIARRHTNCCVLSAAPLLQSTSSSAVSLQSAVLLHTTPAACRRVPVLGYGMEPAEPMTQQVAEERVLKAIRAWDRFPADRADKLTLDARFVEDMGFDSLDLVEITMAVEEEFGYEEIPDEVAHEIKTPRDIVAYVSDIELVGNDQGL